jgi:hypothetical protein
MTEQEAYVARRFLEGATYRQIAAELRTTRGTIAGIVRRLHERADLTLRKRIGVNPGHAPAPEPGPPPPPPTPAMLRLAQFDPVVARAAELRTKLAA